MCAETTCGTPAGPCSAGASRTDGHRRVRCVTVPTLRYFGPAHDPATLHHCRNPATFEIFLFFKKLSSLEGITEAAEHGLCTGVVQRSRAGAPQLGNGPVAFGARPCGC